jgi:hypothetical protein
MNQLHAIKSVNLLLEYTYQLLLLLLLLLFIPFYSFECRDSVGNTITEL